jgi:hypothetical protein
MSTFIYMGPNTFIFYRVPVRATAYLHMQESFVSHNCKKRIFSFSKIFFEKLKIKII